MLRHLVSAGALAAVVAGATAGCASYELIENVSYDERNGERGRLDLYLPDPRPAGDVPLIVLIHGGGWRTGSKDIMNQQAPRWAHAGYAVAAINYRLVPRGAYPLLIQDVFCALGFLESQANEYSFDLDRIGATGYSAGAHLAMLLGYAAPTGDFEPDCGTIPTVRPAAVVSGAGPSDLTLYDDPQAVTEFLGGTRAEVPDIYQLASPVNHVTADDPPTLLIYGTDDLIVPYEHAQAIDKALGDAGVDHRLMTIRGAGHLLNPGADLADAVFPIVSNEGPEGFAATLDFFDDVMGQP